MTRADASTSTPFDAEHLLRELAPQVLGAVTRLTEVMLRAVIPHE